MADELIGGIGVNVTADYSGLQTTLAEAQSAAQQAGQNIAASFSAAASSTAEFDARIQQLVDSGSTLAQALATVSAETQGVGNAAGGAAPKVDDLGNKTQDAGEKAKKTASEFEGMSEIWERALHRLETFGIVFGIKEFGDAVFEAFSNVQRADVALTALTGDAVLAQGQINALRALAKDDALSFPGLLEADQRMIAMRFAVSQVQPALRAAADGAAALNVDIKTTADAMERMAISGMANARQLVALGLSLDDLGAALGVSGEEAKKMFLAMDQVDRMNLLIEAMHKFDGVAVEMAGTLSGEWQKFKTELEEAAEDAGKALAPLTIDFLHAVRDDFIPAIKTLIEDLGAVGTAFKDMSTTAKTAMVDIGIALVANPVIAYSVSVIQLGIATLNAVKAHRDAAEAADEQQHALNRLVISMHQQGIDTQELTEQYNHGEISQEKYLIGLQKLAEEFRKVHGLKPAPPSGGEPPLAPLPESPGGQLGSIPFSEKSNEAAVWVEQLKQAESEHQKFIKSLADFQTQMDALGVSVSGDTTELLYWANAQEQGDDKVEKFLRGAPIMIDDFGRLKTEAKEAGKEQQTFEQIMKSVGVTLDDALPKIPPQMLALHEALSRVNRDLETNAFNRLGRDIKALAEISLPEAINAQARYVEKLQEEGAIRGQILAAQERQLQLEIQLAEQQGKSADKQIVALTNIQEKEKILIATTNLWGHTYQNLIGTLNHFGDTLSHTLAAGIVQGQRFGQIFHNIWTSFAQAILEVAIKALEMLVVKWIAGLLGITASSQTAALVDIQAQAGRTFAAAFTSVIEALPFPFNVAIAPVVAATQSAEVMAGAHAIAAFEKGGWVPEDMLAFVHKGEFVVPAAAAASAASGGGAGVTVNIGTVHGVSRDTVDLLATKIVRQARLANVFPSK